ncbi:hypothetical protein B0T20DRAFT_485029 [Sordaria brevicollis]|uniref:Uncharacterized protein n=1 Tax=Sordaria brevicollis TaxID=83679 RepID=A0AAE0UFP3_SORBR|nr:hypothetical protein B0T20DRAFT_485029 [Sordaria brevicollis]
MSSPYIKREPGVDDSPPRTSWTYLRHGRGNEPAQQRRRSVSPPRARSPVPVLPIIHQQQRNNKQLAINAAVRSDVWQYIAALKPGLFLAKTVATGRTLEMLQLPRQRELPPVWKQRIALEGVAPGNMRLIIGYLVGEETPGRMCNASAANCASLFPSVHPAMMAFDTNEPVIHKAAAFPRCVLLPDTNVCVNGAYRESPAPSMPAIWRPSDVQAAPRVPRSAVPLVPPPVPRHITNVMPQAVAPAPPMSAWEEMRELLYIHSPDDTLPISQEVSDLLITRNVRIS